MDVPIEFAAMLRSVLHKAERATNETKSFFLKITLVILMRYRSL